MFINKSFIKNKEAFTLIELLVTVAIIGMLSSIAIATFAEYKTHAYNVTTKIAMHDLEVASEALASDIIDSAVNPALSAYSACYVGGVNAGGNKSCIDSNHDMAQTVDDLIGDTYNETLWVYLYINRTPDSAVTIRTNVAIRALHCLGDEHYEKSIDDGGTLGRIEQNFIDYRADYGSYWSNYCP